MSDQPEALRLADALDEKWWRWESNPTIELKAAALLRRQHAEIESLKAERDALRTDYGKVCGLVADMHAAATGRPGEGPRLGVVEDVAAVRAECDALLKALVDIMPLADFGAAEQSPPYDSEHLLDAAQAAIDAAREAGK